MNLSGVVVAGAGIAAESVTFHPRRSIGAFSGYVILQEDHQDDVMVTEHPIEQGASISDHAYRRPSSLVIRCAWGNSPSTSSALGGLEAAARNAVSAIKDGINHISYNDVAELYSKLLQLQNDREPMDVYTGKRVYKNMILTSLRTSTKPESEQSLVVEAHLQEVLIVSTSTISIIRSTENAAAPALTGAATDRGVQSVVLSPDIPMP